MGNSATEANAANETFVNWHKSITVGGEYARQFTPSDGLLDPNDPVGTQDSSFQRGLQELMDIVSQAATSGTRVRCYGSKWSLNNIAYNATFLVETWGLNFCKVGIDPTQLEQGYKGKAANLAFVQAGVFVRGLNEALAAKNLALPTQGASDGQRFVGAVSTGTHGSANKIGAMQEYVRGVHVVIPHSSGNGSNHVFIQRASDPVVNGLFANWLDNTTLLANDALFNAIVVSFGSYGLIHGLLIEAVPMYTLSMTAQIFPYPKILPILQSTSAHSLGAALHSTTGLTPDDDLPFHFDLILNPYRLSNSERGAFVRIFQWSANPNPEVVVKLAMDGTGKSVPPQDLHQALGDYADGKIQSRLGNSLSPSATKDIYGLFLQIALKAFAGIPWFQHKVSIGRRQPQTVWTSKGATDPLTSSPIAGTSLEIGIPIDRMNDAVQTILGVTNKFPIAAPIALRFVKPSSATMAFTRFSDLSVTIEMPGPWGDILFSNTGEIHTKIFEAMKQKGIPHTFHWGQQMPVDIQWVPTIYGSALTEWQQQRSNFLNPTGQEIFANGLTDALGITG